MSSFNLNDRQDRCGVIPPREVSIFIVGNSILRDELAKTLTMVGVKVLNFITNNVLFDNQAFINHSQSFRDIPTGSYSNLRPDITMNAVALSFSKEDDGVIDTSVLIMNKVCAEAFFSVPEDARPKFAKILVINDSGILSTDYRGINFEIVDPPVNNGSIRDKVKALLAVYILVYKSIVMRPGDFLNFELFSSMISDSFVDSIPDLKRYKTFRDQADKFLY
jgi:hypothetical protein